MKFNDFYEGIAGRAGEWTIMRAAAWIPGKPNLEKLIAENPNREMTIMVCMLTPLGKMSDSAKPVWILGSAGSYGRPGETKTYRVDTGNGYRGRGYDTVLIQNIVHIDKDGNIHSDNTVGMNDKRPLWVFK